ncbi:hypothetical protein MNBD_GAMMA10-1658 [hydrothermal vent metagenome]|uniref:Uncharacterized protein n=1 Tax=hydrothermal vent metagenome TaxID=652676 RepID=A0A3B0XIT3_9ZZZZ
MLKDMIKDMLKKILLNLFSSFLCLCNSLPVLSCNQYAKELNAGKAVVFIINSIESTQDEQYADWSHYLNQFSTDNTRTYTFHKISKDKLSQVIHNSDKFNTPYSMIFMKNDRPSYFYEGPVIEPQVYRFIALTYKGEPIKPEYLTQFSPDEVSVKFKKCD